MVLRLRVADLRQIEDALRSTCVDARTASSVWKGPLVKSIDAWSPTRRNCQSRRIGVALLAVCVLSSCRWQTSTPTTVPTGQFGSGTGYTAQCSGDFPDWISIAPPPSAGDVSPQEPGDQRAFQLAQNYPLGNPVLVTTQGGTVLVDHWDPPAANQDAPWRAFTNLSDSGQRTMYLAALKSYILDGMSDAGIDFNAVKNNARPGARSWFHVPMMTEALTQRREPYHGVTSERSLRPFEQTHWLNSGQPGQQDLKAVAIGYYNFLGGYTIGQVFNSYDLLKTDPNKARFIDGALVFKLLFAQYDPARIKSPDPLAHSPVWYVQDASIPTAPLMQVRLLQVDVAVKDDHFASTTGWVFATYVYDESLIGSEPNPWRRLTSVGIQWGNDPTVTVVPPSPTLSETWINPARPAAFLDHLGRGGRLIGPIDNPASSCISCHSTAEVDMTQKGSSSAIMAAAMVPPTGPTACTSTADQMAWFRNLPSGPSGAQAFGKALSTCPVNTSIANLTSLDYSLQLKVALQSVFGFENKNACASFAKAHHDAAGDGEASVAAMRLKARTELLAKARAGEPLLRSRPQESSRLTVERPVQPSSDAQADSLQRR